MSSAGRQTRLTSIPTGMSVSPVESIEDPDLIAADMVHYRRQWRAAVLLGCRDDAERYEHLYHETARRHHRRTGVDLRDDRDLAAAG